MSTVPREAVVILSATDARVLWQAANLNALRLKHRSGDTRLYKILVDIYQAGLMRVIDAADGNDPRQDAATEESRYTRVPQLAQESGIPARTLRHHIGINILPATKAASGEWIITRADAQTYLAGRRKN